MPSEIQSMLDHGRMMLDEMRGQTELEDLCDELKFIMLELYRRGKGIRSKPGSIESALEKLSRDNISRLAKKKAAQIRSEGLDDGALEFLNSLDGK